MTRQNRGENHDTVPKENGTPVDSDAYNICENDLHSTLPDHDFFFDRLCAQGREGCRRSCGSF